MGLMDVLFSPGGSTYTGGLSGVIAGEPLIDSWKDADDHHLSTSAIVRRCVNAIAQPLASLDLTALDANEEAINHPFLTVFNRGVAGLPLSARVTKEVAFARMEWRGQAFLYMDRGDSGTGDVRGITPIYRQCKPVVDVDRDTGDEVLLGFKVRTKDGGSIGLLPSEVLWLRYPDPDDPWGCIAPWTAARWAARLDRLSQGWQEAELKNGNRAAAVVHLGDLDPAEHDKAVAQWNRTMVGPRSANRAFLTSGPTPAAVNRLGLTAKEVAYLDSRKFNMEEVALAFGIDRDYLFGESKFENKKAGKAALWEDTLTPKLEVVASEVDRQVFAGDNVDAAWDLSDVGALKESEDAAVTRLVALLGADAITVNEARAERGLEPLPNGDVTLTFYRQTVGAPVGDAGATPADAAARLVAGAGTVRASRAYVTRNGLRFRAPRAAERRTATAGTPAPPAPPAATEGRAGMRRDEGAIQKAYDRLEARGRRAVARFAAEQERAVTRAFGKASRAVAGTTAETRSTEWEERVNLRDFFDTAHWTRRASEVLEGFLGDVFEEGASRTASSLGSAFDVFEQKVLTHMRMRLEVLAGQINATTEEAIRTGVLEVAAEEGLSIKDASDLLRLQFADLSSWRAETIARSETVGGFNAASRDVAQASGAVASRTWLAAKDDRVRDSHRRLDGFTTQSMDDPYPNGLMHPGDPSGPARETVNCRCVEIYNLTPDEES